MRRKGKDPREGKLRIGILYEDKVVSLSRSISGVVSFWCQGPIQIWNVAPMPVPGKISPNLCINTVEFEEHEDGSLSEVHLDPTSDDTEG